jgi:uncharacterized coiled-coil DUF342 family protein
MAKVAALTTERDEARHGESVATATLQGVIEERTTLRAERDRKNLTIQALTEERDEVVRMANKLTDERDEARRRTNFILTEIDCRIEHGAESNGHLEAIRSLFKEDTDE